MSEFVPVLLVSDLDGTNGFRLDGDAFGDNSGHAVAGGGDVNGDGFADLLIGARDSDTDGANRGLAWVVFGAGSAPSTESLGARVAAGTAYRFQGEAAGDEAGFSIANAGDVNGDGFDDFIIGARRADPDVAAGNRGASYLVFGGAAKLEAFDAADGSNDNQIALANITPATGFRFDGGASNDYSGYSVSGAGDVNGDGIADLLIGAPFADPNSGVGNGDEGASYIVFGGLANLNDLDDDDGSADGRIDLANISAGQGLRLDGATAFTDDQSGQSVALVGDVNGDGFDDVLVGARFADPNGTNTSEGAAYLVFGREPGLFTAASLDLANLSGLEGTRFDGVAAADQAGRAVNGLGDVNGDGFADIVIAAPTADPNGIFSSGSAYVVFGKSAFGPSSDLSSLNGANGFRLDGLRGSDYTGISVSGAGDINGDGFDDILIGASLFDRLGASNVGAAYVVFGKGSGFDAVIDLGSLDGDDGFRIEGAASGDFLGRGVSGAGDVNGDGFDDIVVGAYSTDNNGLNSSGSAYVIYGHRADTAVTRVGTALNNTINGGKGDDSISGLSGNDTLIGWEGDDTIDGGDGNDTVIGGDDDDMITSGSGRDMIDGGEGNDVISGGSGRDTIIAGAGEDAIDGGSEKDTFDFSGFGNDAIKINLASGSFLHVNGEDVQSFTSIENVIGTRGDDTITGSFVNNTLQGGRGADMLRGGDGRDQFAYTKTNDSGISGASRDVIKDFTIAPGGGNKFVDRIDLSDIDAVAASGGNQDFTFIGSASFTAEGQLRIVQAGANAIVSINTTGTGGAEMSIVLQNVTAADVTAADFIL